MNISNWWVATVQNEWMVMMWHRSTQYYMCGIKQSIDFVNIRKLFNDNTMPQNRQIDLNLTINSISPVSNIRKHANTLTHNKWNVPIWNDAFLWIHIKIRRSTIRSSLFLNLFPYSCSQASTVVVVAVPLDCHLHCCQEQLTYFELVTDNPFLVIWFYQRYRHASIF